MPTPALYDVLYSFKDIHNVVLTLVDDLDDEQLNWKPEGYSTSIGFPLWHLARESDYLKSAILKHTLQIGSEFGDGIEIWQKESLAPSHRMCLSWPKVTISSCHFRCARSRPFRRSRSLQVRRERSG